MLLKQKILFHSLGIYVPIKIPEFVNINVKNANKFTLEHRVSFNKSYFCFFVQQWGKNRRDMKLKAITSVLVAVCP